MSTLTPHGACLLWKPELVWLNAVSDATIAIAFFATAFVLGSFVLRRRRDVMFPSVFASLAIFAAVCGVVHLLSILTLWQPAHGVEGVTKGFLAVISVALSSSARACVTTFGGDGGAIGFLTFGAKADTAIEVLKEGA